MPPPNDPHALAVVRWSFVKIFFVSAANLLTLLISFVILYGSIVAAPTDPIGVFGILAAATCPLIISIAFLFFMRSFFSKVFFRGYAIFISADYRSVSDTRGNFYIAGRHEPVRFGAQFAFFPEYARQDGTSSPPVTIRSDRSSFLKGFLDFIAGRRFVLPLLFARDEGRIVRGLMSTRP